MAKYNRFNYRPFTLRTGMMGELIPIGLFEVLPGDVWDHNALSFLRCTPLVTPPLHPVEVRIHHWYVPNRIVWEDWDDFITGGEDGLNASVFPTISITNPAVGSLADALGVPTGTYTAEVSALPFRGYQKIWNEWYRFQKLQTAAAISVASGADATTSTSLQNCTWMRDRFTAALEETQLGAEVTIPLVGSAPVEGIGVLNRNYNEAPTVYTTAGGAVTENWANAKLINPADDDRKLYVKGSAATNGNLEIVANLDEASSVSLNALREAWATQKYREHSILYGARINEYLMRSFGVRASDARLQRPEYLGGGKAMIQFSEVLQTATGGDGVGSLFGHGISAQNSNRYRKYIEESGYIFSFISVRPVTIYADGLERHWNKRTKEDFYQPEFAHVGLLPVQNKEVRATHASPEATFAYQPPYDEYRYLMSSIAGLFRSTYNDWHFGRLFSSDPAFNSDFVKCVPAVRPFADQSNDNLLIESKHRIKALRCIAKTGTPGGLS